ncbi:MAG: hypothetical protein Q8S15_03480 [Erysipelotrichaceae bacterium]|nr:hypothetical protein [Erysipelotrichaceae bacterium]
MKNQIIENMNNPKELERMYRLDPETFIEDFNDAWKSHPESDVLSVWNQRLNYQNTTGYNKTFTTTREFRLMAICTLFAGISTRIILYFTELSFVSPINLLFTVMVPIILYFLFYRSTNKKIVQIVISVILISIIYINLLPMQETDSILLSYLHLPIVLWMMMGLAYTKDSWQKVSHRLSFLKINGEFIILYAIMAISGMILALITIQLFQFTGMDISEFYMENIVLFGASSLSIVGFYLVTRNLSITKNIAPIIARIFGPLVLLTLFGFLFTMVLLGKNPFSDRDFLLFFNIILIVVLAVSIFSISERKTTESKNIFDYSSALLLGLAIVIDFIALSAILFRLSSYGISVNRIAVLGINLIILIHLVWILRTYIRFLQDKVQPHAIQSAITIYLPVYGLWAAIVTFTFPIIFR